MEPEKQEKTLLRPSQVTTYLSCSAKYRFQYIDEIKTSKPLVFAFGTSIHSALKKNYTQKIQSETDLPVDEVVQEFSDVFETEKQDVDRIELIAEPDSKDIGVSMVRNYQKTISPSVQPEYVEEPLSATWVGVKYGMKGTPDILTQNVIVKDHKTSKRKYAEPKFSHKIQGTAYKMMFNALFEKMELSKRVAGIEFDLFIKNKKPEIVTQTISESEKLVLGIFQKVGEAIDKGVADIPNRESFLCTRRFCSFWEICEKTYGGTVKE